MPIWLKRKVQAAEHDPVQAASTTDDVIRIFYDKMNAEGKAWWWVRTTLANPFELVVDDDEGGLYKVAVAFDGEQPIFSEPRRVQVEYVDDPVAAKAGQLVLASYGGPENTGRKRRTPAPTAAQRPTPAAPKPAAAPTAYPPIMARKVEAERRKRDPKRTQARARRAERRRIVRSTAARPQPLRDSAGVAAAGRPSGDGMKAWAAAEERRVAAEGKRWQAEAGMSHNRHRSEADAMAAWRAAEQARMQREVWSR